MDLLKPWLAGALLALSLGASAQPAQTEVQIKAAFLYKFGSFVEWPPGAFQSPASAFEIGVLGADALAGEVERLVAGRTMHDRPIVVRRLRGGEPLEGLHALFVGAIEGRAREQALERAKGLPLLVVTDAAQGLPAGSMINFISEDDRVRFDVALAPAERGGLKISARLLAVARKVVAD
jgi:hypothetical protein